MASKNAALLAENFDPGEFTKLFQKARVTVDLIFLHGIDWQAFLVSFQHYRLKRGIRFYPFKLLRTRMMVLSLFVLVFLLS
jgi:hypothetical protein